MSINWSTVDHHNFARALTKAYNAAATAQAGHCILITGPTGVGKSFVLRSVLDMLVGTPSTWPDGELRYLSLECDREAPGAITRNIAVDLNRALGNPFVALRLPNRSPKEPFGPVRISLNEHDLRESFRVLAALRKTRYVGLDAVENVVPRQEISAEARFDSIKSLIRPHSKHERSHEMTLIMVGHYHLLKFWRVNAQLARRVTEIPVFPYRETARDIARFERILEEITPHYPLKGDKTFRDWNDVLFRLSAGCIGLLRKLLDEALIEMRCRGARNLELDDVIAAAPRQQKLEHIQRDLDGFWPYMESSATRDVVADAVAREHPEGASPEKRPVKRSGRVGRKAGPRDPVGVAA